jgi:hypothetical protein
VREQVQALQSPVKKEKKHNHVPNFTQGGGRVRNALPDADQRSARGGNGRSAIKDSGPDKVSKRDSEASDTSLMQIADIGNEEDAAEFERRKHELLRKKCKPPQVDRNQYGVNIEPKKLWAILDWEHGSHGDYRVEGNQLVKVERDEDMELIRPGRRGMSARIAAVDIEDNPEDEHVIQEHLFDASDNENDNDDDDFEISGTAARRAFAGGRGAARHRQPSQSDDLIALAVPDPEDGISEIAYAVPDPEPEPPDVGESPETPDVGDSEFANTNDPEFAKTNDSARTS